MHNNHNRTIIGMTEEKNLISQPIHNSMNILFKFFAHSFISSSSELEMQRDIIILLWFGVKMECFNYSCLGSVHHIFHLASQISQQSLIAHRHRSFREISASSFLVIPIDKNIDWLYSVYSIVDTHFNTVNILLISINEFQMCHLI